MARNEMATFSHQATAKPNSQALHTRILPIAEKEDSTIKNLPEHAWSDSNLGIGVLQLGSFRQRIGVPLEN